MRGALERVRRREKKSSMQKHTALADPDSIFDYLTFRACRSKFLVCMPPADWPLPALVFAIWCAIGLVSACSTFPERTGLAARREASHRTTNT